LFKEPFCFSRIRQIFIHRFEEDDFLDNLVI